MFSRPGITGLRDQAVSDVLVGTGLPTLLRRSPLRALAYAQAGLAYGQYGYLDWIARQSVPFSATGVFLEAWAALVGVTRKPAAAPSGLAAFTGVAGSQVPVGTLLRDGAANGWTTTAALTLGSAGTGSVGVVSLGVGTAFAFLGASALTLASPVAGVLAAAVGTPSTPGADVETDDAFRTRMLLRWSSPPQGGSVTDYLEWALAIPGVTRAWVRPRGMGAGTVVVYTAWDVAEAAHGGIPQGTNGVAAVEPRDVAATGDLLAVANAIYPLQPVTALVYASAPIPAPTPFTITTVAGVPATTQAEVAAALSAVFLQLASPLGTPIQVSEFITAVADGLASDAFTMNLPALVVSAPVGSLPVLGPITWRSTGG